MAADRYFPGRWRLSSAPGRSASCRRVAALACPAAYSSSRRGLIADQDEFPLGGSESDEQAVGCGGRGQVFVAMRSMLHLAVGPCREQGDYQAQADRWPPSATYQPNQSTAVRRGRSRGL